MDATALRAMQAPIKERYKGDPGAAMITLRAKGSIDEANIACKVETGRALAVAGLHPATGGSGLELCSGDMLLEALVACAGVTLKAVSTALDIPLKARGSIDDTGIACKVETGRALAVAGLHPATGGSGLELCSGDMLLEALVACAGVTLKAVSTALDIPLKSGHVSAEGDLDFRGTLGVAKDAPVGFAQIRLTFDVDTDAPQEKLDQLLKLTERYCVVYQTIRNGPPVAIKMQRV